jgi:hypothetical protein
LLYAVLSNCNKTTQHYAGRISKSQHDILKPYSSDTNDLGLSTVILIVTGLVSDGPNISKRQLLPLSGTFTTLRQATVGSAASVV